DAETLGLAANDQRVKVSLQDVERLPEHVDHVGINGGVHAVQFQQRDTVTHVKDAGPGVAGNLPDRGAARAVQRSVGTHSNLNRVDAKTVSGDRQRIGG